MFFEISLFVEPVSDVWLMHNLKWKLQSKSALKITVQKCLKSYFYQIAVFHVYRWLTTRIVLVIIQVHWSLKISVQIEIPNHLQ